MQPAQCTVVTIAHRLSTVQKADQIAVLGGGGTAETVRKAFYGQAARVIRAIRATQAQENRPADHSSKLMQNGAEDYISFPSTVTSLGKLGFWPTDLKGKMPIARATPAPCPRRARASVLFPR
eukprot:gene13279-biopygen5017